MAAKLVLTLFVLLCWTHDDASQVDIDENSSAYAGTASVTQGYATTTVENLYPAGQRIAGLGIITSKDKKDWVVPAKVNYNNSSFPFAPDLYNPDGTKYAIAKEALTAFNDADIVDIDATGDIVTAYIFGDNYFELYVNGVPVGKDTIPFTQFNSHIVKFKVSKPFTIAMKLVDWEENLGLGSEKNRRYRMAICGGWDFEAPTYQTVANLSK